MTVLMIQTRSFSAGELVAIDFLATVDLFY